MNKKKVMIYAGVLLAIATLFFNGSASPVEKNLMEDTVEYTVETTVENIIDNNKEDIVQDTIDDTIETTVETTSVDVDEDKLLADLQTYETICYESGTSRSASSMENSIENTIENTIESTIVELSNDRDEDQLLTDLQEYEAISFENGNYRSSSGGCNRIYDVNRNGIINFQDAGLCWVYAIDHDNRTFYGDLLYDVNMDGQVNFQDAGLIWVNRD